jgi:hypothetical protein
MGRFGFYSFNLLCPQKAIHKLEQKGSTQSESLNVVSAVQNALNAIKRRRCKEKMHSMLATTSN